MLESPVIRLLSLSGLYFVWGTVQIVSMFMDEFWSKATFAGICGAIQGIICALILIKILNQLAVA